jgi:hypothetical protein
MDEPKTGAFIYPLHIDFPIKFFVVENKVCKKPGLRKYPTFSLLRKTKKEAFENTQTPHQISDSAASCESQLILLSAG